jgi:PAS domain S-box-containing protein/diguanylate cyclase (GGDEF)-like protein
MSQQCRILIVEDVATDAELALKELKRAGIRCGARRVETAVDYRRELEEFQPHVILSDFTMPRFGGMEALAIARQSYPDIPFIFVSGTLGEEYAVRALKNGATDYVLKTNLIRLPAAVERATQEAKERQAHRALEQQVHESEKRYRELFQSNPHPMWVYDIETLRFLAVNDTAVARYGFSREEFLAMTIKDIRPEEDVPRLLEHVAEPLPLVNMPETWQHQTKSRELIDVEIASHDLVLEGRPARIVVAYNITERKRTEEALQRSETRLRAIIETEPECVKVVAGNLELLEMNQAGLAMLQASSLAEAQQQTLLEFIVPEHRAAFEDLHKRVMNGESGTLEFEVIGLKGTRRWLETRAAPLRDAAGEVLQLLGITHDVTERKRAEQALRESEAKYRQLIEQAADGIFLSDADGNYLLVNSRGCELLGYAENELLGLNALDTYVEEEREIHARRIEQVRAGESLRFERMVRRKDGSTFSAEVSSKMLDNGLIQVIFHDITDRRNQEQKIRRLSRIQAVLSGINSAIVRIRDRRELFQETCRIIVEHGGFTVGWISALDHASGKLVPVAKTGLPLDFDAGGDSSDRAVGLVPMGTAEVALRENRPAFDNDIEREPGVMNSKIGPDTLSVRRVAIQMGAKSVIVLPLIVEGKTFGILTLYAPERNFFDDEELKLLTELAGDISFGLEFIAKAEKVDYLAYYDALTGLPNRTLFSERMSQQLHTRAESPELVAVALMDVEHFRMVNDALSRQTGDEVLRLIARRLESNATMTRCSNPARVVGDSFGVIIRGARDVNELAHLLEEGMKACFGVPFVIDGKEVQLVARAGVSAYPTDGSTAESLLHNAEAALRKAKQAKERFVFYAPEMNARVAEFLVLETKLRKAIDLEQFVLHYQPKFDIATGKTTGVEALIRWNDPDMGLVPPLRFIPILEETGMIFEVGRWALRQAVRDQQRWRGKRLPVPRVAVNVSARQLRDQNFVRDVQLALESEEGLKPSLELEITESLLMEDIERNIERLKTLRDLGVTIAIDDFGTGYSSLNYLARLPMDALKIDRSFVVSMSVSPESRAIVSAIISLAHSLGLKVIAEGVETEEQLNLLRLLKCDEMQGFLLSRPVPPDKIASFLKLKKTRATRA